MVGAVCILRICLEEDCVYQECVDPGNTRYVDDVLFEVGQMPSGCCTFIYRCMGCQQNEGVKAVAILLDAMQKIAGDGCCCHGIYGT